MRTKPFPSPAPNAFGVRLSQRERSTRESGLSFSPAGRDARPTGGSEGIKVGMISLGCAKNLVDAEIMLGSVLERGMEITSRADEADVLVINTCAFIDSAKEESIEAILQADQLRKHSENKRPNQKTNRERLYVATVWARTARRDAGGGCVYWAGSSARAWGDC